ncbi:MAG: PucR family transcriptional regulator ligand-binding domain-containing protein [Marmoricola sp.]|nr:PucR family transcriptional regulator ligand-binding domain-containing protein [Marmoricola sp.]
MLRVPAVRTAGPEVLAGAAELDRTVRWVHTTELVDIGPLLRGGDLVLTTGIALPDDPEALERFVTGLVESDAAGLFLELGRRWSVVPRALVEACERLRLPLVVLHREVRFAALTQAVGERLVDEQLAELREAQRVHDTFTELSIAEAGPGEILDAAQRLAGGAVALESEQHVVLDVRAGSADVGAFLEEWERRSGRLDQDARTLWDDGNGWLVTRVGRPERAWGRLVIESPTPPSQRLVAVAERAAAALAMHRLHDRTRDHHVRRLHQELLQGLLSEPGDVDLRRRVELAGIPVAGSLYVGMALRPITTVVPGRPSGQLDELVAAALRAAELVRRPVLVAAFESDVRLLMAVPARSHPDRVVERFVEHLRERVPVVAAQGSAATGLEVADRTLREALQVLASAGGAHVPSGVLRLHDLHVRGLLALLAGDDRVRAFAERELEPLREDDDLRHLARTVVEHWDNKSLAAQRLNLSRPALYARIATLQHRLGVDLGAAETRTSLHVALILDELLSA